MPLEAFKVTSGREGDEVTIGTLKAIVRLKRANNRASGLQWTDAGTRAPEKGIRLNNEALAEALKGKVEFAPREWADFSVLDLRMEHFVEVAIPSTSHPRFFQPASKEKSPGARRRRRTTPPPHHPPPRIRHPTVPTVPTVPTTCDHHFRHRRYSRRFAHAEPSHMLAPLPTRRGATCVP